MKLRCGMLRGKMALGICCFLLVLSVAACGNKDFVGNSYKLGNSITIEFQVLNRTETEEIDLKSGDTVDFIVASQSGQLDIEFGLKDARPDYKGNSVETGSFTVTVHQDGRYILTVTGSNAKGSVKLIKEEQK